MIVKLLTEHRLEFLSLKGGCRGLSESKLVKMLNCWKSHAAAHIVSKCITQIRASSLCVTMVDEETPNSPYSSSTRGTNWDPFWTALWPSCPHDSISYLTPHGSNSCRFRSLFRAWWGWGNMWSEGLRRGGLIWRFLSRWPNTRLRSCNTNRTLGQIK